MGRGVWQVPFTMHIGFTRPAYVDRDPSRLLPVAIPVSDIELLDTWSVVGLGGDRFQRF